MLGDSRGGGRFSHLSLVPLDLEPLGRHADKNRERPGV